MLATKDKDRGGTCKQYMRKPAQKTILARRKKISTRQPKVVAKVVQNLLVIASSNINQLKNSIFRGSQRCHNAKENIYSHILHKATVHQHHHLEKGRLFTFNNPIILEKSSKLVQINMNIQKNLVVRKH